MAARKKRAERDIDNDVSRAAFVTKLRRLADALESGKRYRLQVAGERISVPPSARLSIEHERDDDGEEIEFQLSWS
ncbi:MAG: amphi-Trp domain-containing protein, partial [Pseudomonadota bacterium]